jgi:hypothetical protein
LDRKEIASNSHVMASVWKENNFEGLYKLQMRRQKIEKLLKALMQGQTPGRNCKSDLRGAVCKVAMAERTNYTHQNDQQSKRSSIRCMDACWLRLRENIGEIWIRWSLSKNLVLDYGHGLRITCDHVAGLTFIWLMGGNISSSFYWSRICQIQYPLEETGQQIAHVLMVQYQKKISEQKMAMVSRDHGWWRRSTWIVQRGS